MPGKTRVEESVLLSDAEAISRILKDAKWKLEFTALVTAPRRKKLDTPSCRLALNICGFRAFDEKNVLVSSIAYGFKNPLRIIAPAGLSIMPWLRVRWVLEHFHRFSPCSRVQGGTSLMVKNCTLSPRPVGEPLLQEGASFHRKAKEMADCRPIHSNSRPD